MNKSVALVLKGYTQLNSTQRQEFIEEINKYINGTVKEQPLQKALQESIFDSTTVNFGPAPNSCPCCGN